MRDKKVVLGKYVDIDAQKQAHQDLRNSKQRFREPRRTVQIRIRKEWHSLIQEKAREEELTLSKFLDQICRAYFGKNGWRRAKKLKTLLKKKVK